MTPDIKMIQEPTPTGDGESLSAKISVHPAIYFKWKTKGICTGEDAITIKNMFENYHIADVGNEEMIEGRMVFTLLLFVDRLNAEGYKFRKMVQAMKLALKKADG